MKKQRVFIAGPISDLQKMNYWEAEKELECLGHEPINPLRSNKSPRFLLLKESDSIYVLDNWPKCNFCKSEVNMAIESRKGVIFQNVERKKGINNEY
jgi:hypothetical protein